MRKKIASLLTVCVLMQSLVPASIVAAQPNNITETDAWNDALDNNLTMENAKTELDKKDKQDDDGDGLLNYWEDSVNTDKNNADTDGDGLTDYQEVVLIGTDPLKKDTNGDGIEDAYEDADGDGLTNVEEIKLGTDPSSIDTDGDGLTDWQEVKDYGTNPSIFDTDKDGADDGYEVEKMKAGFEGFDPLVWNENMDQLVMTLSNNEGGDKIVGSLQIVGSHNPDALFTEGHSFLVYTSYVDGQKISVDNLYGSYRFNQESYKDAIAKDENLLSWRSLVDECTEENDAQRKEIADDMWPIQPKNVSSYTLNRGDYVSIGNFTQKSYIDSLKDGLYYGQSGTLMEMVALQALYEVATGKKVDIMFIMSHVEEVTKLLAYKSYIKDEDVIDGATDGGLWVNREMFDQRYQYDQYPHEIYKVDITQAEFDNMMKALNSSNYYNLLNHNCSSVASYVWNAAVGYEADENGLYLTDAHGNRLESDLYLSARGKGVLSIMDFPGALCENIIKLKGNGATRGSYYSDYSNIVQGSMKEE